MKSALFLFLTCTMLSAVSPLMAQDAAKGKTLFAQCIQCHGEKADGIPAQKAPRLAGQHDWYLIKQISEIKSGVRKNPVMVPIVAKLSEQDIKDLAAYITTL